MINSIKSDLKEKGYSFIPEVVEYNEYLMLSESFGKIICHPNGQFVDVISPKKRSEAKCKSFSFKYELSDFPLHTDTAFWSVPARYIAFFSIERSFVGTKILSLLMLPEDLRLRIFDLSKKSIFLLKTPEGVFYRSSFLGEVKNNAIRFDPCCMIAINDEAKELERIFISDELTSHIINIDWSSGGAVFVDNWLCFHGRQAVDDECKVRKLARIYME